MNRLVNPFRYVAGVRAREMGLSYPTVRNKLDDIIDHLKALVHEPTR